MYNATLFLNTGFNAINIPDNPSLLYHAQYVTVPALDIYQARELSSFVVKATYASIKNADYLKLENPNDSADFAYYSVQNITMTSMDTAVISVTMDYILTAGGDTGISSLQFTDGICERHHVALSEDKFGAFDEEDPYLAPAEMMRLDVEDVDFGGDNDQLTLLETTANLSKLMLDMQTYNKLTGIDFTSSSSGDNCVVPMIDNTLITTNIYMENENSYFNTTLPGACLYKSGEFDASANSGKGQYTNEQWTSQVLTYVRSLGIESSIIAQYNVPSFMVDAVYPASTHPYVGELKGKRLTQTLGNNMAFIKPYTTTIRNKRLLYGEYVKYSIVSIASGNKAEFLPEEIYDYNTSPTSPTVEMRVDPRPKGAPYFRFNVYRGVTDPQFFFTNAVKGLEWQNAPLVYEGASGSLINQYKFKATMAEGYENVNYAYMSSELKNQQANMQATGNTIGSVLEGAGNAYSGHWAMAFGNIADAATNEMNRNFMNAQYELGRRHAETSWNITRNNEMASLAIRNNIVAPSMNFPISEGIRDFVGNTCLVYRPYYTENDAARIDKILSMYGYRNTIPMDYSVCISRSKFNWVEARGVAIKNLNIPKWLRDGVAAQFAAGLRIWHVLPDTAAYTDGSNT